MRREGCGVWPWRRWGSWGRRQPRRRWAGDSSTLRATRAGGCVRRALGGLGSSAATPAVVGRLLDLTSDASEWVREAGAVALGRLGPAAATPAALDRLLELTRDAKDWGVRGAAARALGRLGPTAAIP